MFIVYSAMVLGEASRGSTRFWEISTYPAPPFVHALHDDDVDGVVAEGMDDGLPAEPGIQPEPEAEVQPEPALPLGCRWRVPLTWVLNSSGVLLLYRDQLDAQTSDQVIICKSVWL